MSDRALPSKSLSSKQRAFVEHYLTTWNASQAAREAGYSEKTAREQASRMLTNVHIQAAIQARLAELTMSADEVLARLSAIARGSIADVLALPSPDLPESEPEQRAHWDIDLVKAQRTGAIRLVKKIRQGEPGPELELYSALDALQLLGKAHRLFVDRAEHSGPGGGPIPIVSAADLAAARAAARAWEDADDAAADH